ncbi:hypothetical protein HHK36_019961 [Tetracentron sinense]|uniref:Pentatricopeptide repeat-containing protein n=1 Tax=Tetracentron sinense TaxID=13715 RepID=A0A835D7Y3_TETSI|nr:hypothetical protein HHK36_019961 [Tetracentron sinense]
MTSEDTTTDNGYAGAVMDGRYCYHSGEAHRRRPTIFTCNSIMAALLRQSRYSDLLLVDQALQFEDEMVAKGFAPNPVVYNYLMLGRVKKSDSDGVLDLYNELKEKLGFVSNGIVCGSLMKGYFFKEMEKEAMYCYIEVVGENSMVRMGAMAYNSVLNALCKNGKLNEVVVLFDRMMEEHNPPRLIMGTLIRKMVEMGLRTNLVAFNKVVSGLLQVEKIEEAMGFFYQMVEKLKMDAASYEVILRALCDAGKLDEVLKIVDEIWREEDLVRLLEKEREKAEALAKEVESAAVTNAIATTAVEIQTKEVEVEASIVNEATVESVLVNGDVQVNNGENAGEAASIEAGIADVELAEEESKGDKSTEEIKI